MSAPLPSLPGEVTLLRPSFLYPAGRIGFDEAHQIGTGSFAGTLGQNVQVVGGSVDGECYASDFTDDSAEVGVEIGFDFGR